MAARATKLKERKLYVYSLRLKNQEDKTIIAEEYDNCDNKVNFYIKHDPDNCDNKITFYIKNEKVATFNNVLFVIREKEVNNE